MTTNEEDKYQSNKKGADKKHKLLQWHPAFYAGLQIEFGEETDKLIFEREHNLSTKHMQIDVLVIKKQTDEVIHKNIGRIFRKYNIIEYKSPTDYLSRDGNSNSLIPVFREGFRKKIPSLARKNPLP